MHAYLSSPVKGQIHSGNHNFWLCGVASFVHKDVCEMPRGQVQAEELPCCGARGHNQSIFRNPIQEFPIHAKVLDGFDHDLLISQESVEPDELPWKVSTTFDQLLGNHVRRMVCGGRDENPAKE